MTTFKEFIKNEGMFDFLKRGLSPISVPGNCVHYDCGLRLHDIVSPSYKPYIGIVNAYKTTNGHRAAAENFNVTGITVYVGFGDKAYLMGVANGGMPRFAVYASQSELTPDSSNPQYKVWNKGRQFVDLVEKSGHGNYQEFSKFLEIGGSVWIPVNNAKVA